jgi:integrase/recombinase XerD
VVGTGGGNVVRLRAASAADLAERTFEEMLEGWRNQQLARNLAFGTINPALSVGGAGWRGGCAKTPVW